MPYRQVGYVGLKSAKLGAVFAITEGDPEGVFDIDASTGLISTRKLLDRETGGNYDLTVTVVSSDTFDQCSVRIEVTDLNDNPPELLEEEEPITLSALAPIGQPVHRVMASDPDSGANGRVRFELPEESFLRIDADTGILSVKSPVPAGLDETVVTALGKDGGSLTSSRDYRIRLVRGNTHSPTFDFTHSEISVAENTAPGTVIIQLTAVDLDEGLAGKLTYTVSDSDGKGNSGSGSLFGVFPDGRVYLQDHLDRESQAYHSLTVTARDGDTVSPRSSSASVVVYVTDVNDNSPRYTIF